MGLRPYQRDAVDAVWNHIAASDTNPAVVLPTGSGKTHVIAELCRDAVQKWNGRVIVVAHVKELIEQAAGKLQAVAPDLPVGVFSAGLGRRDLGYAVTIAGIQSVYQRAHDLGPLDLVIVDEAHLIPPDGEGMYRRFLADARDLCDHQRVIGLTATPYRMKTGTICGPESVLHEVCFEAGVRELIVQGYLCPLKSRAGKAVADTSDIHVRGGEFVAGELEDRMDEDGLVEAACAEVVAATVDRRSVLLFCSGGGVRRDADHAQSGRALEAALCMSAGLPEKQVGSWYDEKTMNAAVAADLRGAGLHTLIYETIRAAGDHVRPGRVDNEMIRSAFAADRRLIQAAGGGAGFSTISLSGILSNVANKTMLAAYTAVESVIANFSAETDVNDFKEVTRYRLTGNGIFEKVGPDGELKHAGLSEQPYTNKVETFGRMIALTRQMMINDDLGAFLQIPRIIGRMSALKREEAVFELLLANPGSFFSASNKNFISGADTALSIDGLTKAEVAFMDQVDSDGKPLGVMPQVLLVPTALSALGSQLFKSMELRDNTSSAKYPVTNPHQGKFRVEVSRYLSNAAYPGQSSKAWYMLASPADLPVIEVAFLNGQEAPTIETAEQSFNRLGIQMRGYHDFGVALQDPRGGVKSKGEA